MQTVIETASKPSFGVNDAHHHPSWRHQRCHDSITHWSSTIKHCCLNLGNERVT